MYEILPLTDMVRPQVAVITTVEPVHIEFFLALGHRRCQGRDLFWPRARRHGGDRPRQRLFRANARPCLCIRSGRVITFGEHEAADVRAHRIIVKPDHSIVDATIFGQPLTYRIGTAGGTSRSTPERSPPSSARRGSRAGGAILRRTEAAGRARRADHALHVGESEALLIDESYNANPASMRAALANLGAVELGRGARRIAVLGDMKELGETGPRLHAELAEAIEANRIDLLFAAGP